MSAYLHNLMECLAVLHVTVAGVLAVGWGVPIWPLPTWNRRTVRWIRIGWIVTLAPAPFTIAWLVTYGGAA